MSFLLYNLWVTFINFHFSLVPAYLRHRLQRSPCGLLLELLFLLLLLGESLHLLLLFFGSPFAVGVPAPNLPFIVSAPAVDESILSSSDGVVLSSGHLNHVVSLERIQVFHPGGNTSFLPRTDPKLPPVVQAPREKLVLVIQVERVLVSAKDVNGALCSHFLNEHHLLVFACSGCLFSANLARFAITPTVHFATSRKSQCVLRSTCNLLDLELGSRVKEFFGNSDW